jgi:hypothetical protein
VPNHRGILSYQVSKPTLKTRAFQEACVFSVVEELTEHLALWSYSVAFMEFSFIPIVRLRSFCKLTKVERFRREMKQLIREVAFMFYFYHWHTADVVAFISNI